MCDTEGCFHEFWILSLWHLFFFFFFFLPRWDCSADEPPPRRHRGCPRPPEVRQARSASLWACPGSLLRHPQTQHPTVQQLCVAVCLREHFSSHSLLRPPAAPSPPLLLSFQTQGSTSAFLFLLVFFFFCFLSPSSDFSSPIPTLNFTHKSFYCSHRSRCCDCFLFFCCFFLSHSPALVPAAVRYLVGTVTPHVTYVIYIYLLIKLLFFSIRSGRSERFSDWWDRQSDFTLRFQ